MMWWSLMRIEMVTNNAHDNEISGVMIKQKFYGHFLSWKQNQQKVQMIKFLIFLLYGCSTAAILPEKENVDRTAINEVIKVNKGHQNLTDNDTIKVLIMDSDDPLDNNVIGLRLNWNIKTADEKVDLLPTQPNPIFLYDRHLMCSFTFHGKFYMVGGKF